MSKCIRKPQRRHQFVSKLLKVTPNEDYTLLLARVRAGEQNPVRHEADALVSAVSQAE